MSDVNDTIWTEERIRACGVRMSGVAAVQAVYGYGSTKAYEMLAAGDVDFPVIRRGRSWVVPTAAVLELLGLVNRFPAPAERPSLTVVPGPDTAGCRATRPRAPGRTA